ncbi:ABC transporter substrate-binding protein [Hyphomicrobium facile]|uniref:Glycine betaine/proline transport system substrate-binding protein n=1 Tax=Hyphomicrobium facile TaxID=51670 RepID=A0A1I7NVI1_9HYPH|nr:ABC transporter substrate-binding protein [Hyphomicrobium facile]SFV38675.1 glycine betaine/proline transport system substrate-binding protein [Hyphomicrobium facile]
MLSRNLLLSVGFIGLFTGTTTARSDSSDPISIALNNWSSQNVSSYILGGILEREGYKVNYVQADAMAQFAGLETGDITFQTEIWPTTQGVRFEEGLKKGGLINMGKLGIRAQEEWWYPTYVKKFCPTLPDWHALLEKDCAKAFATAQTGDLGRYLGGPADWEGHDEDRVAALGLPWKVIHAGSDVALWAEVDSAYKRKAPVMIWGWSPHWWPTKYEGEFVEFPAYSEECYNDPKVGPNPDAKYDCGKPRGDVAKAAWIGGKDKWPGAYTLLQNMKFDEKSYGHLIAKIDVEGQDAKAVANEWIDANKPVWEGWK